MCDCHFCTMCGHPIMDRWFIVGYCQKRRGHRGSHDALDGGQE